MPSPTNDTPEQPEPLRSDSDRLAERMANLSPAQRELLRKRLAQRAGGEAPSSADVKASPSTLHGPHPIAIVGMGCRLPGAASPDEFWQLIDSQREAVGSVPPDRWDRDRFFDPTGRSPGKMSVDVIAAIDQVDRFDPAFFGIAPREASRMDPQQRLLLEVAWETFENAGIPVDSMAGSRTGVFIGIGGTDYSKVPAQYSNYFEHIDAHIGTGNALSIAAGRISYLLDFHGPSFIIDTACSSALVAIHTAIVSLVRGESDAAIAGGVNLILSPETTIAFSMARMLSPDGHCRPFDQSANGYVRGEGCGLILLKRLSDAVQSGDHILGVIRGSAVNQDGRTSGITAPSGPAQQRVIRSAMQAAGVTVDDITYVEAHGTGTPLGDPIELSALDETFAKRSADLPPVRFGSVKANIGHTETVSGVAGLLKVLQMFAHDRIPAQANFDALNPNVQLRSGKLKVADESELWAPNSLGRWIAGVSSFGFGGTNAHLIVEKPAACLRRRELPDRGVPPSFCLPLSSRDESALHDLAGRMSRCLDNLDAAKTHDSCVSASTDRTALPIRAVAMADSTSGLQKALTDLAADNESANLLRGQCPAGRRPRIAMLFTGQGSQYLNMAGELQKTVSSFRRSLQQSAEILDPELPIPLADVLSGASADHSIDHTSLAQPAICAVQCALVDSLTAVGIRPDVVAGHSIGEIAALYAAGAMSRTQALLLSAYRGKAMGDLPAGGAMAAILTDADTVTSWIEQRDSSAVIATMNGSTNTVVAGDESAVEDLIAVAKEHNVMGRQLAVSHAFHTPLMQDAADPLREKLRTLFTSLTIPGSVKFLSTVTGQAIAGTIDAEYWIGHLLKPVRFTDVIRRLQREKIDLAIEVGPQSQLCNMIRREEPDATATSLRCIGTLDPNQSDFQSWIKAVASAWSVGVKVDWKTVYQDFPWQRAELPTYPFQRQRFWYDPPTVGHHAIGGPVVHPLLGTHQSLATGGSLYSKTIREIDPSYLADHVVSSSVTVPAAAWIEALRAAASETFQGDTFEVEKIEIERALFLESGISVEIQSRVHPVSGGRCRIQIDARRDGEEASWQTCASAVAVKSRSEDKRASELPPPGEATESIDVDGLYDAMADSGLRYGRFFQVLDDISSDGRSASATLHIAEELRFDSNRCRLHPTLLDGALQLIATVIPHNEHDEKQTMLPVGVERLRLGDGGAIARAVVQRRFPVDDDTAGVFSEVVADVELLDQDNVLVAQLQGVRLKSLRREQPTTQQDPATWLHQTVWTSTGATKLNVKNGQTSMPLRHFGSKEFEPLVAPAFDPDTTAREHWIWACPEATEDLVQSVNEAAESLLTTIQSAIRHEPPPQLSIVAIRAFAVASEDEHVNPVATALVGLARVAANEHPQLEIRLLDVDQCNDASIGLVADWLTRSGDESELALRRGVFFKPRLVRSPRLLAANDHAAEIGLPPGGSFRVRLDGTDRTEGLWVERMSPPPVGPGRVQVNVSAVGLNFSDVLKSMGLYPGIRDKVVPLGIEVCGRVTDVGDNVDSVAMGTRVMGVVPYGFASDAVTNDYLLTQVPDWLSDDEAACLPIVFLTAHHALLHVGRLTEGESVLIHAGAGGVGLAAIQIAQSVGATIYTTAGHPTKRRLLAMMGVDPENIFDSRDLRSIDMIRERTGGRGVDVVLNSLPGEWIDASIGLLAAHGRFLEIGKIDIYQNHAIGLLPFQDNLTYAAIDLDRLFRERPEQVRELFAEVREQFDRRVYQPLPMTSYRLDELPSAMRFMAARRNIGKIVVKPPRADADIVSTRGVHLITGGSGAIGLGVARRLIERGACAIALVARRTASDETLELIRWAESQGAKCIYLQADCCDESCLQNAIESIPSNFGPIVGVVHAAGLLDDGLIHEMSAESLHRVLKPKVAGAVALDRVTKDQPVETFTLLGSVASVFGSPGQANYAASNAFLEGFARDRLRRSLPASIVHWGPWASAGMADDPTRSRNLAARGLRPLRFEAAVDMLIDASTGTCPAGTVVVDADWNRMLSAAAEEDLPSLLRDLRTGGSERTTGGGSTKDEALIAELLELIDEQRTERLTVYFAEQLGRIMSMDASSIDPAQPLGSLGLDSLMAIELKNTIEAKLDITLPISRFMDDPTLESLSEAASEILAPAAVTDTNG